MSTIEITSKIEALKELEALIEEAKAEAETLKIWSDLVAFLSTKFQAPFLEQSKMQQAKIWLAALFIV